MKDLISIGQIINTHGLKGELKVYPLTDDIKRFHKIKEVIINDERRIVSWCKLQTDKVILKIEGIDSIEQAEKLKGIYVEVDRSEAVKLPKGRYFVADIIGCTVLDTEGKEYGKIDDVVFTGSNDVYWIKGKKELLIPAIESVIVSIEVESKKMIIRPLKEWHYED
jgi:16S rRNA processing protein RimM